MIFIFCSLKCTFHAFGVKIKFCRNLRNFQFHQDAVNTEVYSVFMQFSKENVKLLDFIVSSMYKKRSQQSNRNTIEITYFTQESSLCSTGGGWRQTGPVGGGKSTSISWSSSRLRPTCWFNQSATSSDRQTAPQPVDDFHERYTICRRPAAGQHAQLRGKQLGLGWWGRWAVFTELETTRETTDDTADG